MNYLTTSTSNVVYTQLLVCLSVDDLITNSQSERTTARLRSLQGQGAEAWLEVILTSDKHTLKSNEFSIASHVILGLACHSSVMFVRLWKGIRYIC
jgi:hypothetical protein